MKQILYLLMALSCCLQHIIVTAQVIPLPGHSHNDYERPRPLYEALELGYRSIEVDVHLHKGQLKVSHDPFGLDGKPTLQALYLEPLLKITRTNAGLYGLDSLKPLVLMIDFKSDGEKTYQVLKPVLASFKEMLVIAGEGAQKGYVQILISGDKPYNSVAKETQRWVSLDYKFDFCREHASDTFITRASDTYKSYFTWNGIGEMPWKEKLMLDELVNLAHSEGRQIRFWAVPETPELWKTFLDMGVDWIHVDDIKAFQAFYMLYLQSKQ